MPTPARLLQVTTIAACVLAVSPICLAQDAAPPGARAESGPPDTVARWELSELRVLVRRLKEQIAVQVASPDEANRDLAVLLGVAAKVPRDMQPWLLPNRRTPYQEELEVLDKLELGGKVLLGKALWAQGDAIVKSMEQAAGSGDAKRTAELHLDLRQLVFSVRHDGCPRYVVDIGNRLLKRAEGVASAPDGEKPSGGG